MGKRGRQSSTHLMEREGPEQARKEVKNLKADADLSALRGGMHHYYFFISCKRKVI